MGSSITDRWSAAVARQKEAPDSIAIDDPMDVEDRMIRAWLGRHASFDVHGKHITLGTELLPSRWRILGESFTSKDVALSFLHRIVAADGLSKLRSLEHDLSANPGASDRQLLDGLAHALVSGRIWALKRSRFPAPAKADPEVFRAINAQFGTQVDFDFLAQWEGGQHLHGYVPFAKDGRVAGRSGVTIATGFDIGQKSAKELQQLGLASSLAHRLVPFAGKTFKMMSRHEVIQSIGKIQAPIPIILKGEANQLDKIIHGQHLSSAIKSWNENRKSGVPTFVKLSVPWQTVLFSRTFHQGVGFPHRKISLGFYGEATSGRWSKAIDALRNYPVEASWYQARVRKEAAYLSASPLPAVPAGPVR